MDVLQVRIGQSVFVIAVTQLDSVFKRVYCAFFLSVEAVNAGHIVVGVIFYGRFMPLAQRFRRVGHVYHGGAKALSLAVVFIFECFGQLFLLPLQSGYYLFFGILCKTQDNGHGQNYGQDCFSHFMDSFNCCFQ